MTTLDPILYANGALRLTRHGPKAGGNILVLTHPDGRTDQCEIADDKIAKIDEFLSGNLDAYLSSPPTSARSRFDVIRSVHAVPGSTRLAARR